MNTSQTITGIGTASMGVRHPAPATLTFVVTCTRGDIADLRIECFRNGLQLRVEHEGSGWIWRKYACVAEGPSEQLVRLHKMLLRRNAE